MELVRREFDKLYKLSSSSRKDSALTVALGALLRNDELKAVMAESPHDIRPLISALQERNAPGMVQRDAYNPETAPCFHSLLVAALKGYGKMLRELCDAQPQDKEIYARQVWTYGYLLWQIAYSRILEDHLNVLVCCFTPYAKLCRQKAARNFFSLGHLSDMRPQRIRDKLWWNRATQR